MVKVNAPKKEREKRKLKKSKKSEKKCGKKCRRKRRKQLKKEKIKKKLNKLNKTKGNKGGRKSKQSTTTAVQGNCNNITCLNDMLEVLKIDKDTVQNYIQQKRRLDSRLSLAGLCKDIRPLNFTCFEIRQEGSQER